MKIQARNERGIEYFAQAREKLDELIKHLAELEIETLATTEEYLRREGDELLRLLLQARLDVLFERERTELGRKKRVRGIGARANDHSIESLFGRVTHRRHAVVEAGKPWQFPMDEALNIPADLYSHSVRRRVGEEVAHGSFDHAVEQISRTTAAHVPKRQAQQLTVRAARDVEAFYVERSQTANDTVSDRGLLLMSSDGAAIRVINDSLREPTRRAAEKSEKAPTPPRGDPTARPPVKPHQTRRAIVTAVWEQERHERTAADIVANLLRDPADPESHRKARGPKPQRKRVTASIEQDVGSRVREMFDEADRRDPDKSREAACLVDGDAAQTEAIKIEAARRGRSLTIVLDLLHAMHYLWIAAQVLASGSGRAKEEAVASLVARWTSMLLTRAPHLTIAAIRAAATRAGLRGKARQKVDAAADYLLKRTPFLNYQRFIALGLPIATGVIEGACRHLVRDRMDITGARWELESAEAVLKLRAVQASGDWDDYWAFHQQKDQLRIAA